MSGSSFFHLIMHKTNKVCILECIRHNRKRRNIYCHNIYLRFFGPGFGAHTVGLARDNSCIFTVSLYFLTILNKGLPLAILHHCIFLLTALISQYPQGRCCYVQYHIIFCRLFNFLMILNEKIYSFCLLLIREKVGLIKGAQAWDIRLQDFSPNQNCMGWCLSQPQKEWSHSDKLPALPRSSTLSRTSSRLPAVTLLLSEPQRRYTQYKSGRMQPVLCSK